MPDDSPVLAVVLGLPADFPDDTRFFKMAVAKFIRDHPHGDVFFFGNLSPNQQSEIIASAQGFKVRHRERTALSFGQEGAGRE